MTEQSLEEIWRILSGVFDDLDTPNKIVCSVNEFRSRLWEKHRINRNQFQEMLEKVCAEGSQYRAMIHLSGGPTGHYTKTNFVEVWGRHWLHLELDTPEHMRFMEGHRG
jgi:hypothetical protein